MLLPDDLKHWGARTPLLTEGEAGVIAALLLVLLLFLDFKGVFQ